MPNDVVVKVENLVKNYKLGKVVVPALKGISLEVKRGEFVSIMGPSGCGKSTLMNLIGCLDHPTSGQVYIDGVLTSKLDDNQLAEIRNQKVGFVFQMFNLLPRLNALENIEMPLIYRDIPLKERLQRAEKALESVDLSERKVHRPSELSGGQMQRVAIARALINNPAIILADEPTGNLDSKSGQEIMAIFQKLNSQGVTIIMVSHEPDVVKCAKRAVHLKDGQMISDEPVQQVIVGK